MKEKNLSETQSNTSAPEATGASNPNVIFPKINLLMMGGCLLLIILGFILMSGSGSSIETGFNPDIFSFRRIVLGPAITFIGFLCMAFAIIFTPRHRK